MKFTFYRTTIENEPEAFTDLLSNLMRGSGGKVFSGTFKKLDGSLRTFNGRATAEDAVIGTGSARKLAFIDNNALIKNLKSGMDKVSARRASWRSFVASNLISLKVGNTEVEVIQN